MKKFIFFVLFFGLISALTVPAEVGAIGQITEPIVIENALRGQEVVSKLTLLNSESTTSLIGIMAEGEIAEWATFYAKEDSQFENPIEQVEIQAGVYQDVMTVFRIPEDIANGEYVGEISAVYNPSEQAGAEEEETSSTVAQKISRQIRITVSDDEVIDLSVSIIPEKYDYHPGDKVKIRVIYDNQSNIMLSPSVQFKVKKDDAVVYNVIYPYPDGEAPVRSMSMREVPSYEIPTDSLGQGKFLVELDFLRGDEVLTSDSFSFTIAPGGLFKGAMISKLKDNFVGVIIVILVLAGLVITVSLVKKNKAIKKGRQTN